MIKVYSGPHVKFAALLMVEQLAKLGHPAEWVPQVDPASPDLHIIYQACTLAAPPKDYIVCQTEPRGSHWFNDSYDNILKNAKAIWDYSPRNIGSYACMVGTNKIALVHPGVKPQPTTEKDIDYLFYGWIEGSPHRERMLNELSKKINLKIVTDKLEEDMWAILARTKVVINIQHKPGNPLEGYRICEALSHGCHIITEGFDPFFLGQMVTFMPVSGCGSMIELPYEAEAPEIGDLSGLDNLEEIKKGLEIAGIL